MDKMSAQKSELCIIDDEKDILDGYRSALEGVYDIVTFESGAAALEALDKGLNPHIIVSDLRMPAMSGFEVVENLRTRQLQCGLIISSGHADKAAAIQALNLGVHGFIEKPHTVRQLKEMLSRVEAQLPEKVGSTELLGDLFELLQVYYNRITVAENELTRRAISFPESHDAKAEYDQWLQRERVLHRKIEDSMRALRVLSTGSEA